MRRRARHLAVLVVALGGLLALAVSVAWVVGLVEPERSNADPDFMWQPLDIGDNTRLALGLGATALAAVAIAIVWRSFKAGDITRTVMIVLSASGSIAAYGGMMYGVGTAPVTGANIGGGLMLLAAGPFVVITIAVAVVAVVQQRRRAAPDRRVAGA